MKKKVYLGMAAVAMVLGMTSCKEDTSASNSLGSVGGSEQSSASVAPKNVVIGDVSRKESFRTFYENKEEQDSKRTEFKDRERNYVVGDDNKFNVKPIVTFEDEMTGEPVLVSSWNYRIEVYIKDNDEFVLLGENDLATYVSEIDKVNCDIDFTETAIGKTFKIVVTPDGLTSKQEANERFHPSMEFEVIDGYNAYNAKELAYYDNSAINKGVNSEAWAKFKTDNGLDPEYYPNAIILHDDIYVEKEDLPSIFFYNDGDDDISPGDADYEITLGSLRDHVDIYTHFFGMNDQFTFYGNYYTLSIEELPYATREDGVFKGVGKVISHANLFRSEALKEARKDEATCKFTMRDLNLIGNAPKQENTILGGGLIMNKNHNMKALMENIISINWFITYFPERDYTDYRINNCKAYDNFNCFIYNWGGKSVTATNSEFIGAGGPVLIQDHVDNNPATGEGGSVGHTVFTNCTVESVVAGTEGWFNLVGASALATPIKALNGLLTSHNANFVFSRNDTTMFNLISVNKAGGSVLPFGEAIMGSVKIDDNPAFDYGETNPGLKQFITALKGNSRVPDAPIFQSSGAENAYVFTDQTNLFSGFTMNGSTPVPTVAAADHPIFEGDYFAIYYQGMCFTFGYYHPTPNFD